MSFLNPQFLWLLAALPVFFGAWLKWGRRSNTLKNTQLGRIRVRSRLSSFLTGAIWVNRAVLWTALVLGLAGASFAIYSLSREASGIVFITQDTSGSMTEGITNPNEIRLAGVYNKKWVGYKSPKPGSTSMDGTQPPTPTRIAASLGAIKTFIEHSHGLPIGLTTFDDQVYYVYPPTKDHKMAISLLPQIKKYEDQYGVYTGTNFDGPNGASSESQDGALQGAINVFANEPANVTHIFIMVTDGDSSISSDRAKQLQAEFKRLHIHMFVFGIGSEWASGDSSGIQPLINFVKSVGGEVAPVENTKRFNKVVMDIDNLARSTVHTVRVQHEKNALLLLLSIAGISLVLSLGLSALRRSSL